MKIKKARRAGSSSIVDTPASGAGKSPLFLRVHKSGNSFGIYFPVPCQQALRVKAGDSLRVAIDESARRLILTPAE